ncbi:TetR/AcrR family transcriptional regulator [Microbacterium deminutum]|uniref:TetR/AcrR family transcriptional regulator n=1 Tax=Microbacterium deminutum TaxID=344164 RepID=A0ABN2Q5Q6_9MICO
MTAGVRGRMIDTAVVLLAKHGYQATSFSTVLEASGAPRGSIYHHFPDGKDQLIGEAVRVAGDRAIALLDSLEGRGPIDIAHGFLQMWRALLVATDTRVGCSVLAVTVSAPTAQLRDAAGAAFAGWRGRLAELLVAGGAERSEADRFAALLIAGSEGAVVMARASGSLEPFDTVADQLEQVAARLSPDPRRP